jgi:hypothetical protein
LDFLNESNKNNEKKDGEIGNEENESFGKLSV